MCAIKLNSSSVQSKEHLIIPSCGNASAAAAPLAITNDDSIFVCVCDNDYVAGVYVTEGRAR